MCMAHGLYARTILYNSICRSSEDREMYPYIFELFESRDTTFEIQMYQCKLGMMRPPLRRQALPLILEGMVKCYVLRPLTHSRLGLSPGIELQLLTIVVTIVVPVRFAVLLCLALPVPLPTATASS